MKYSRRFQTSPFNTPNGTPGFASTYGRGRSWHISVLVPARDEEVLLPRCLFSIQRARMRLPLDVTSDVIVVDDGSSDATRAIAERMLQGRGIVVRAEDGIVGKARSIAAETAIRRCPAPAHLHWLANTDADCCVPETWLLDQLRIAATKVEAIAGIVGVDSFEEHGREVEGRFCASYLLHPDGTHCHVHGANFGVRADAYLRVGGWNALATAEDHDLWNRLRDAGSLRASIGSVKVITSGRRIGRAPLGFAQKLASYNNGVVA